MSGKLIWVRRSLTLPVKSSRREQTLADTGRLEICATTFFTSRCRACRVSDIICVFMDFQRLLSLGRKFQNGCDLSRSRLDKVGVSPILIVRPRVPGTEQAADVDTSIFDTRIILVIVPERFDGIAEDIVGIIEIQPPGRIAEDRGQLA